jgi:ABC-2 type transport system ATP-binding protein
MRRRLLVAKAMVHAPPVLVLDEPTAGVDIELRQQLWEHIRELNQAGTTVLLTTHYLEEAEQLCDRIAIINHGELVACDTTEALLHKLDYKGLTLVLASEIETVPAPLRRFNPEIAFGRRLTLSYRPSQTTIEEILDAVHKSGLEILDLTTEEADLEDAFLSFTARRDDAEEPAA